MCQLTDSACCCVRRDDDYCHDCDQQFGVAGFHVIKAVRGPDEVTIWVESCARGPQGCPECGVLAYSHGRRVHRLVDAPSHGTAVVVMWKKRKWRCVEPNCPAGVFTEKDETLARPRALLTTRVIWWAIQELSESASVEGLRRRLGCSWETLWSAVKPVLQQLDDDPDRFNGVAVLGVDEHVWHHMMPYERGPNEVTGMVDLTRDKAGNTKARLLDLVPGRSGAVFGDWLTKRGPVFLDGVQIATLDPFRGYKNAIDDKLADATSVLDAFHVVKLGVETVDAVRRRVQQSTTGRRGGKRDPLYGVRNILRSGAEKLTERQWTRLNQAIAAHEDHQQVFTAWAYYQKLRNAYRNDNLNAGLRQARDILDLLPTSSIPEVVRLGKTLNQWRKEYLGYFTTNRSSNGGVEAINGVIELHRRIARGFINFNNYRLRCLLAGGAYKHMLPKYPHQK